MSPHTIRYQGLKLSLQCKDVRMTVYLGTKSAEPGRYSWKSLLKNIEKRTIRQLDKRKMQLKASNGTGSPD